MDYLERDCPGCGRPWSGRWEVRSKTPAEEMGLSQAKHAWRGFSRHPVFFSYSRCLGCGLLYCPSYFSQAQLQELYASMPDNTDGVSTQTLHKTHQRYAARIMRGPATPAQVLELGADIGLTLREVQACAPTAKLIAVEPNLDVHDELQRRIPAAQVLADLSEVGDGQRLDLVLGIHVLDHLLDLGRTLEAISRLVQPSGAIAFVVHNEASLMRKGLGRRWPPFCLQHPQLFNPTTLKAALLEHGWSRARVEGTTNYFPVRHLGLSLAAVAPVPERVMKMLPEREVGLRLGNMLVVARA